MRVNDVSGTRALRADDLREHPEQVVHVDDVRDARRRGGVAQVLAELRDRGHVHHAVARVRERLLEERELLEHVAAAQARLLAVRVERDAGRELPAEVLEVRDLAVLELVRDVLDELALLLDLLRVPELAERLAPERDVRQVDDEDRDRDELPALAVARVVGHLDEAATTVRDLLLEDPVAAARLPRVAVVLDTTIGDGVGQDFPQARCHRDDDRNRVAAEV